MRWLGAMDMNLSYLWETVKKGEAGMLQFMGLQRVGHDLATKQQQHKRNQHTGEK